MAEPQEQGAPVAAMNDGRGRAVTFHPDPASGGLVVRVTPHSGAGGSTDLATPELREEYMRCLLEAYRAAGGETAPPAYPCCGHCIAGPGEGPCETTHDEPCEGEDCPGAIPAPPPPGEAASRG